MKIQKFPPITQMIVYGALMLLSFIVGFESKARLITTMNTSSAYPEIAALAGKKTFVELSQFFAATARRKGAVYAFKLLNSARLPPNTDMHLLGHVIGDVLFRQEGINGIYKCTQDFRNACSHSIVVGLYLEKGEEALTQMADICRKAPGGSGAYTMCFHGLGHGILAAVDYDLEKSIGLCMKTGTQAYEFRESAECVGGAVMEILSGGGHDPARWAVQSKKYSKADDPLYPCDAPIMPENARVMCYDYVTPNLFKHAGIDSGHPDPAGYPKAFALCNKIPALDVVYREACFGGFGKEFVAYAQDRDIRLINQMTEMQLQNIVTWCDLAGSEDGITACITHAANSLYWGGENDYHIALSLCRLVTDSVIQSACFNNFVHVVRFFTKDQQLRAAVCSEMPAVYRQTCRSVMHD